MQITKLTATQFADIFDASKELNIEHLQGSFIQIYELEHPQLGDIAIVSDSSGFVMIQQTEPGTPSTHDKRRMANLTTQT